MPLFTDETDVQTMRRKRLHLYLLGPRGGDSRWKRPREVANSLNRDAWTQSKHARPDYTFGITRSPRIIWRRFKRRPFRW